MFMMNVKILIDSVEKVKNFSAIVAKEDVECELIEGVHIIDAKSIMGIFSLDLTKPLQLVVHSDDTDILNRLKDFIIQ
jgi:phosphocarrier protein HPr